MTQQSRKTEFVERLLQEINQYRDTAYSEEAVETIYFGGGTPSLLTAIQIENILSALGDVFTLNLQEVTLEMNPDDVTKEYLYDLKNAGITRASMGVQSFQPELLQFMNRAHTQKDALTSLELLSRSKFSEYTVDLIYGNPAQSSQQLAEDIELLMKFEPPHISAYSLTVEPNTRLGKQVELNRIIPAEDNRVAEQFELLNEQLSEHGIDRYEVSNYSNKGKEAKHNSRYWTHQNYLGLGPGAHSFWWDAKPRRWQNAEDIKNYPEQPLTEHLSMHQLAEERIMMGLRTREGIAFKVLNSRYDYYLNVRQISYLEEQQKQGTLRLNDSITLTDDGILVADSIILDLITQHEP